MARLSRYDLSGQPQHIARLVVRRVRDLAVGSGVIQERCDRGIAQGERVPFARAQDGAAYREGFPHGAAQGLAIILS